MRFVHTLLLFCSFVSHASVSQGEGEHNRLTPEQIAEGWISLFDGETLFGWEPTSKADWCVEDGVIRVGAGEKGFLMTTSKFFSYDLYVEYRCPPETNSGIFVRSTKNPRAPQVDCVELNIAPKDNPFPTGKIVGQEKKNRNGDLERVYQRKEGHLTKDPWDGGWHSMLIRCNPRMGNRLIYDGYCVNQVRTKASDAGHIGLQFNEGTIEFRNIRLQPEGAKPLFNGKDLTGWNTKRADASEYKVMSEGELQVLNGRGQLETDDSYGDFLLQLECFVNGDALNSGIFFRCIPRDFMMGYECQIQNGMKDNDPTKPQDCGTGGIFRRQNARRIVAKDRQWFALTLIADGPHMAAWVDGQQVSDWTDTRKPNENPRRGLRLEPGTLAIQGHDPTTDLRFRKLKIAELPAVKESEESKPKEE